MLDNTFNNDYLTYIFLSLPDTLTTLFFELMSLSLKRDLHALRVVNFKRDSSSEKNIGFRERRNEKKILC